MGDSNNQTQKKKLFYQVLFFSINLVWKVILSLCSLCLPHGCRLCARWSRTTQPGNRGWPSSWSRWWPSWAWRAEDCTSQGALGRDPIRNRAVPERRPVPALFFPSHITWLPPSAFQRWLLPRPSFFVFCFLQAEKIFLFNSSTLLHRLVLSEYTWRVVQGLRFGISHSAMQGIPQLHHGGELQGGTAWKLAILAFLGPPCWKKKKIKRENLFMLPSRIDTDRKFF